MLGSQAMDRSGSTADIAETCTGSSQSAADESYRDGCSRELGSSTSRIQRVVQRGRRRDDG